MAYGLKVRNADLELQIDGTYRNYFYKEGADNVEIVGSKEISFANSTTLIPLILFRPDTDKFSTIDYYVKSDGNYTGFRVITEALQTTHIDWKMNIATPSKSAETYGMRVYNSGGDLIFDSGLEAFKIIQTESIDLATPTQISFPYEDITHSSISDPFYILSFYNYWVEVERQLPTPPTPSKGYHFFVGLKKLSSTSVRVGWYKFNESLYPTGASGQGGGNPTIKLIVCDVT